ncbi:MAG: hypothetical protein A2283_06705 [Lentisphaerae bacterium RIFOXYA12_FULL_48_11]|nr:MAG: hypothetical protein A2283_06705 [Lentisphaerae bacterium RIFOXYA12_FULL_48_11]
MTVFQNKPKLPVRKLRAWLKLHRTWDGQDWLTLLSELRMRGYGGLTDNSDGQETIGRFLEANRVK